MQSLTIELVFLTGLIPISLFCPQVATDRLKSVSQWFNKIANQQKLAVALIGFLAFVSSALATQVLGTPLPTVGDEFSYLLAADTFSQGRLTNPTHPLWHHFETFFVIHEPTYMSKYPPAQGMILALGKLIGGHPIVGVWISSALACAALCWMLQAWVPPRWAFLGGLIMVARIGIFGYWAQSYWGGMMPAFGGALLFGALRRIIQSARVLDSALLGLGLAVLANSRPMGGLIVSVPCAAIFLIWLAKKNSKIHFQKRLRAMAPVALIVILTGLFMLYYNFKITENPLKLPYQAYGEKYSAVPHFLWQPLPKTPRYRYEEMQQIHVVYQFIKRMALLEPERFYRMHFDRFANLFFNYFSSFVMGFLILLMLPWLLKNPWMLLSAGIFFVLFAVILTTMGALHHYLAPAVCLFFLIFVQSLRLLRLWKFKKRPSGKILVYGIVLIILTLFCAGFYRALHYIDADIVWARKRASVQERLSALPGKHLVIVTYGENRSGGLKEWVYNLANINESKVVWARSIDQDRDSELVRYFHDRHTWLLKVDGPDDTDVDILRYQ